MLDCSIKDVMMRCNGAFQITLSMIDIIAIIRRVFLEQNAFCQILQGLVCCLRTQSIDVYCFSVYAFKVWYHVYFSIVWVLTSQSRANFSHIWKMSPLPVKGLKLWPKYPTLEIIEQWGFFSISHVLWCVASIYNGHLWGVRMVKWYILCD